MLPAKNDPLWGKVISDQHNFEFKSLAARMMYSRVRQLISSDDSKRDDALEIVYAFFKKNEDSVEPDLELIKAA